MTESNFAPLDRLRLADPDTYVWVRGRVAMLDELPDKNRLTLLAEETIRGLALEPGLGEATAKGLLHLISKASDATLKAYVKRVRKASETGATLGRLAATFWAPVLLAGGALTDLFDATLTIMLAKGTYTLNAPLEVMAQLLSDEESAAAASYLELLAATFCQNISYNQSLRLVYLLPKAVHAFVPQRREAQIAALARVVRVDLRLVDPFIEGMEKGLDLLDKQGLNTFVDSALEKYGFDAEAGIKFIGLSSTLGKDACAALQKAVPLVHVNGQLNRYLQARVGRPVAVKTLNALPEGVSIAPWVVSDGRFIYLPAEIDRFRSRERNRTLYKTLTRLEAGNFECATFDFDMERAADRFPVVAQWLKTRSPDGPADPACDGERFLNKFGRIPLAADLFTLIEHARVGVWMEHRYPGMVREVLPLVQDEARRLASGGWTHLLAPIYTQLVLGLDMPLSASSCQAEVQGRLIDLFRQRIDGESPVEASAELVVMAYEAITGLRDLPRHPYVPLATPFDRRIRWDLATIALSVHERAAARIKMRLAEKNISVYRSDLRNRLADQQGQLTADDIGQLVLTRGEGQGLSDAQLDASQLDMEDLFKGAAVDASASMQNNDAAFYYPEWDTHLQDYLHDHARVQEVGVAAVQDGQFYQDTLVRHHGIVARMRRAFELLKPEGLTILRQWPEGDAFDYRALIDFVIDRRAGRMPSDRLFIKRLKQERDVAVLLLVDLSRSTANPALGRNTTVLGVAKEALVLFCEALQVVGDTYAIAGFSGTGRHSVDYFPIKDFAAPLAESVRTRISALAPQRSTRMGAAIRHGSAQLARIEARVRLMIVVSDGFPNDLGYKADYAIADTRQAVQEARAKGFHLKAITVNIGSDPRLDELYGRFHHHVIGDVRELPDKLLRLYGTLTRL